MDHHHRTTEQVLAEFAAAHGLTDMLTKSKAEFQGLEAIPRTLEHYRLLADSIPHLAWRSDTLGRAIDCNRRWFEYTGQSPEEAKGYGWMHAICPDDLPSVLQYMLSADAKDFYEGEYRLWRASDASYRWHLARSLPVKDDDGKVVCWLGSAIDISDRKRAEEALRDSEHQLRCLFEYSPDAVFLTVSDGRIVAANPAAVAMFNMTEQEICRVGRAGLGDEEDPEFKGALEERSRTGRMIHCELPYFRKGGERFVGETSSVILPGEDRKAFVIVRDTSERRRAEQALRESESFKKTVLNTLPAHVAVLDRAGTIVAVNDAWLQFALENGASDLSRISEGSNYLVACRAASDASNPEAREALSGIEEVLDRSRLEFSLEYPCHSPTQQRWFMMTTSAMPIEIGGAVVCYVDITARKQAEEALRRSEAKYRSLFQNMLNGFAYCQLVCDSEGRPEDFVYLEVNAAFQRITGIDNIVGRRESEVFPGVRESHPEILQIYGRAALTGQPERFDFEFTPLGIWLSVSVYSPAGGYFVAIIEDSTARKRAEKSLADAARQWQQTFDAVADAIWVMDADQRIQRCNRAAEKLLGKPASEIIGLRCCEVFHGTPWPIPDCLYPRIRTTLCRESIELSVGERCFRITTDPMLQESGELFGVVQIAADVTDRRDALAALETARDQLEQKVNERTADLAKSVETLTQEVSERRRAETALGESQQRLALALRSAGGGVWDWSIPDGKIVWSTENYSIFGVDPGEPIDFQGLILALHPEDRNRILDGLQEAIRQGRIWSDEFRIQHPLRGLRWISGFGRPIAHAGRQPHRMVGINCDVTERKLVEETLRMHDRALAAASNGIVITDSGLPDNPIVYCNAAFEQITGYSKEEVLGRNCRFLQGTDLAQKGLAELRKAIQSQSGCRVLLRNYRKDGTLFWNNLLVAPVHDEGHLTQFVGVLEDVTVEKQAQDALRESDLRFRQLAEGVREVFWVLDVAHLRLEYVSPAFEAVTGRPREQFAESPEGWASIIHPDDRPLWVASMELAMKGRPYQLEYRIEHPDGSIRWVHGRSTPVHDTNGQVVRIVGITEDITQRKMAEEELRRHESELAHVGRLNIMGEMVAGLAHELNQPLHAVNNYAAGAMMRLLSLPEQDEELLFALEQLSAEATRAAEVLRRIRQFVQKRERQVRCLSVNSLIEEAVLLSKGELLQHGIRFSLELDADLPSTIGDPIQIEQVVLNLIRNAQESMLEIPNELRQLTIRTKQEGGGTIRVEIEDCGKGVALDDLERVFDPFFSTKPDGMGMGLAISRSIIEAHGGRIWAAVNSDPGCTFSFMLPIKSDSEEGTTHVDESNGSDR